MARATPEKFQFSIKVLETITHVKRLDVNKGAITYSEEFLDKISPLRTAKKLAAILFQLPPSFTVNDFENNNFLINYLLLMDMITLLNSETLLGELKEMLRHYNISAVMTDSPPCENLHFLSDVITTANSHSLDFTQEIPRVVIGIIICIPNKN
jgi:uncharacterized protein YecE (DUF72 family)